jgi:hypothetical protein
MAAMVVRICGIGMLILAWFGWFIYGMEATEVELILLWAIAAFVLANSPGQQGKEDW